MLVRQTAIFGRTRDHSGAAASNPPMIRRRPPSAITCCLAYGPVHSIDDGRQHQHFCASRGTAKKKSDSSLMEKGPMHGLPRRDPTSGNGLPCAPGVPTSETRDCPVVLYTRVRGDAEPGVTREYLWARHRYVVSGRPDPPFPVKRPSPIQHMVRHCGNGFAPARI